MIKLNQLFTVTFLLLNASGIVAMEQNSHIHLMVIPGQNGLGGQNIKDVLPQFQAPKTHEVETPQIFPDFGQKRCMYYLDKKIQSLPETQDTKKIVIHASSQGTATALNYTAENHDKIDALLLESVLLTGNSAIAHTVAPGSSSLFTHYCLPFLAKLVFPFYQPAGKQALFSCKNLPKDLPIIIMHATNDPQLNFKDAQALYGYLKNEGHKNTYLFSIQSRSHVLLLMKNSPECKAIQAILEQHKLLPTTQANKDFQDNELNQVDLTQYQPEPESAWLNHFYNLQNKENNIYYIDWVIKRAVFAILIYSFIPMAI